MPGQQKEGSQEGRGLGPEPLGLPAEVPGEDLRFAVFFSQEHPKLLRAALALTGRRAEAEDLAQEAMVRVCERWSKVGMMESPAGYAFAIIANLHRRKTRREALLQAISRRSVRNDPSAVPGPADDLIDLRRAIAQLTEEQRSAFLLVVVMDLTSEQAGNILRIDPTAIRNRVHRARERLGELLGDDDD